jgi:signal transduction histidine kinase
MIIFLFKGTITLSFTYRDFKTILVEVQDTGIGIKEENI